MEKLQGTSMDIVQDNIEKLKQIFPEIFTEGKIDFQVLKQLLGEHIENDKERYSFTWKGKTQARQIAQDMSTGTLRPDRDNSKDWENTENLYIEGDNLEVLKLLQKSYHGKVKMIYIDPPYNTGKDFVYKDNFRDNIDNYLTVTGQKSENSTGGGYKLTTNSETSGRYHSDWLNMMYPRLKLARNLLIDDGVIFISIDDNEQENLKKICDEIFGENNFVANIVWRKKTGASDSKNISTISEFVLIYTKNNCENIFTRNKNSYDPQRYKMSDEYEERRGKFYIDNLDRGGISYSDSLNYPIVCPDGTITYPNGRKEFKNDGWIWTWGKEKLEWGLKEGFIVFKESKNKESGWGVYYKNYVNVNNKDELIERSAPHKNLILDIINTEGTNEIQKIFEKKVFQYTKPSNFIKLLIGYVDNQNSIILDFFSGSATTAHAVMQLNAEDGGNRKYIMVQLPEVCDEKSEAYKAGYKNICEIGKERIRRAGEKIKSDETLPAENREKLDIGFKVFKLDSSNIKEWDSEAENLKQSLFDSIDNIKSDRTSLDILYEILLKYGLDLNVPIVENKHFYSIGGGTLLINLDKEIDMEVIDSICEEYKTLLEIDEDFKTTVILRDSSFANDVDKTNAMKKLEQVGIKEVRSI